MKIGQTLKLSPEGFKALRAGEKRVTIRRGRPDVELGYLRFTDPSDPESLGEVVSMVAITRILLGDIPDPVLQDDGFSGTPEALEKLSEFYPDLTTSDEVTTIYFDSVTC